MDTIELSKKDLVLRTGIIDTDTTYVQLKGVLDAVLALSSEILVLFDKNLDIIWHNKNAQKIFGEDIIGRKCFQVFYRKKEQCKNCIINKVFNTAVINETQVNIRDVNLIKQNYLCTVNVASFDDKGCPDTLMLGFRNITDQKLSEHELIRFREAVVNSTEGIGFTDAAGKSLYYNKALADMIGNVKDDIPSIHYVDKKKGKKIFEVLKKGETWSGEVKMFGKNKDIIDVMLKAYPIKNDDGKIFGFVGVHTNITDKKRMEKALLQERLFYDTAIQSLPGLFYIFEQGSTTFLRRNDNWVTITGYSDVELDKMNVVDLLFDKELCRKCAMEVFDYGSGAMENALVTKNGEKKSFLFTGKRIFVNDKNYLVGFGIDISQREKIEQALRESEEHYKNFFDNALVGFFRTRLSDGMYIAMNKNAAEQQGRTVEHFIGKRRAIDQYKNPVQRRELLQKLEKHGEVHGFEIDFLVPSGRIATAAMSVKAYPEKGYMEGAIIDITERKKAEKKLKELNKKLKKMVFKDSLTGTINRKPFMDLLEERVLKANSENKKLALFFMDLENFKQVNDIYGHDIGDMILKEAARKIKRNVCSESIVGRVGGDEFVVCLKDIKSNDCAIELANRMNNAFKKKIVVNNLSIDVTVSIGISIFPDDAASAVDLLKNSDIAMYKAKNKMKNSFLLYSKQQRQEIIIEQALLYALDNQEYSIHYQPIVNRNGKCVSIEALLRWSNPDLGLIPPSVFIPLLEKNKEIIKVGKWVYYKACKQAVFLSKKEEFRDIKISVNLSQIQMEEDSFIHDFINIKNKTGVDGKNLLVEITEHESIRNPKKVISILSEMIDNNLGAPVLDDFGAGYSSFSNLLQFPIYLVKIDKFLVDHLNNERFRSATLNMVSLIKGLNLKVVAEGVETYEQYKMLTDAGCDYFQGYYFSRPIPNINEVLQMNNGNFMKK